LILLVGLPNTSTEDLLNSDTAQRLKANGQVREIFGYASSECERAAFSASDAVWIGRRPHSGPSGVMEIARVAGVPIVASTGDVIGGTVEEHDLGSVVNVTDPQQARYALSGCFSKSRSVVRGLVADTDTGGMQNRGFGGRICDAIFAFENGNERGGSVSERRVMDEATTPRSFGDKATMEPSHE